LVVPKCHISSADDIDENNCCEVAYIFSKIPMIAKKAGITNGYRIITNSGPDSCQSVMHLHFHILGGEKLPEHIR
jgi:histidine triad (HIT) family protein